MTKGLMWMCAIMALVCYFCGGFFVTHNNAGGAFVFGLFCGLFAGLMVVNKRK